VRESLFVTLQRREEEEALHSGISAKTAENRSENVTKEGEVVFAVHRGADVGEEFLCLGGPMATVEDGLVKHLFGRKMAKNNGFGNTRGSGDFLGCGALKAFARKQIESGLDKLLTAVRSVESRLAGIWGHEFSVSKYLLACQGSSF
jgi:hypothetical protein